MSYCNIRGRAEASTSINPTKSVEIMEDLPMKQADFRTLLLGDIADINTYIGWTEAIKNNPSQTMACLMKNMLRNRNLQLKEKQT